MNNKLTHTSGPWHIGKYSFNDNQTAIYSANDSSKIAICIVEDWGGSEQLESEANATLISAAPDLYAALKSMNQVTDGYCICHLNEGYSPSEEHSIDCSNAQKAIFKAEGIS